MSIQFYAVLKTLDAAKRPYRVAFSTGYDLELKTSHWEHHARQFYETVDADPSKVIAFLHQAFAAAVVGYPRSDWPKSLTWEWTPSGGELHRTYHNTAITIRWGQDRFEGRL